MSPETTKTETKTTKTEMPRRRTSFAVTYGVVTEESVADGETAENGWFHQGGWRTEDGLSDWSLRELISEFGRGGFEDGGRSFYSADSDTNYRTGNETRYAIHPPRTITASSYARLRRIFCGR